MMGGPVNVFQATLWMVSGAVAVSVLVVISVGWFVERRRPAGGWFARLHTSERQAEERGVARYLMEHPRVTETLGTPVGVGAPEGGARLGRDPGQANLELPLWGPMGEATAELVMAKLGPHWEVLSGKLVLDGERVSLTGVSGVN